MSHSPPSVPAIWYPGTCGQKSRGQGQTNRAGAAACAAPAEWGPVVLGLSPGLIVFHVKTGTEIKWAEAPAFHPKQRRISLQPLAFLLQNLLSLLHLGRLPSHIFSCSALLQTSRYVLEGMTLTPVP